MIIEEILNELNILDYIYDKQNGTIKANKILDLQSKELGKITSSIKEYKIIFTVDRDHNITMDG